MSPNLVLFVPGGKVTMFFAILMFGEAGRRDPLPQPRFSDLRERPSVSRAPNPCRYRCSKGRLLVPAEEVLGDYTAHPTADHQQSGQPDRRGRGAAELEGSSTVSRRTRRSSSSAMKSMGDPYDGEGFTSASWPTPNSQTG